MESVRTVTLAVIASVIVFAAIIVLANGALYVSSHNLLSDTLIPTSNDQIVYAVGVVVYIALTALHIIAAPVLLVYFVVVGARKRAVFAFFYCCLLGVFYLAVPGTTYARTAFDTARFQYLSEREKKQIEGQAEKFANFRFFALSWGDLMFASQHRSTFLVYDADAATAAPVSASDIFYAIEVTKRGKSGWPTKIGAACDIVSIDYMSPSYFVVQVNGPQRKCELTPPFRVLQETRGLLQRPGAD